MKNTVVRGHLARGQIGGQRCGAVNRTTQGSRDAIAATALATSIASYSEFFGDMDWQEDLQLGLKDLHSGLRDLHVGLEIRNELGMLLSITNNWMTGPSLPRVAPGAHVYADRAVGWCALAGELPRYGGPDGTTPL